jgi:hypothetical protein
MPSDRIADDMMLQTCQRQIPAPPLLREVSADKLLLPLTTFRQARNESIEIGNSVNG